MPIYLLVDIGTILIPFIFSFHPKLRFNKQWKAFFPACFLTLIPFIIWDVWFTSRGIWGFNSDYLIGITILGLPIEEWLFFICIPYACVFTYHCFSILITPRFFKFGKTIALIIITGQLVFAFINPEKLYTSITFFTLATILVFLKNKKWISQFFISYLVILLPFNITNGVLTGSWLEKPIVWYNNNYNLGVRIGTIPIEDIFYGMLLILINVTLFEAFKKKIP